MCTSYEPAIIAERICQPRVATAPSMRVNCVIVGGGPAGLAPLVSASRNGSLERILSQGLAIVERGSAIGPGTLGSYNIGSDSAAETIVSCVHENPHPRISRLRDHPAIQAVEAYGRGAVPLQLVGELMAVVGAELHEWVAASPRSAVLLGYEALHVRHTRNGLWRSQLRRVSDGATRTIVSPSVVLATGGYQPASYLAGQEIGGVPLMPRYAAKLVQSNETLTAAGLASIGRRLAAGCNKRVAIIGSSSSAVACAHAMLRTEYGRYFEPGAVTILHRRPLRVFYPSAADALADGYNEFGQDDICPISGFVYRFAGFRMESRELVMAARGIGGRPPEPRLRLHRLTTGPDPAAIAILDEADVIVTALGYRPRALPVLDTAGRPIPLLASGPGARPLVDDQCRVLDSAGAPIEGLLGIGLAAGFLSREATGGEPSFSGQTNGLWQWQNDVGCLIAERMRHSRVQSQAVYAERAR